MLLPMLTIEFVRLFSSSFNIDGTMLLSVLITVIAHLIMALSQQWWPHAADA